MDLIDRNAIDYALVDSGTVAGTPDEETGRLYLDVGNDLRVGVIDHHHLVAYTGSTARLVLAHPELVRGASRSLPGGRLMVVLHNQPDLDCFVSAYLATTLLTLGEYSVGAETLVAYVDRVDAGYAGMSIDAPFTLYAACQYLGHRLVLRNWGSDQDAWQQWIKESLQVVDYVATTASQEGKSVFEIDAFACPGLFGPGDRHEVEQDIQRYRRKLADVGTHARRLKLRLPSLFGGAGDASTLLVRDVQNIDDPERVIFFKHWARNDKEFSLDPNGFDCLCVCHSPAPGRLGRVIVSVSRECDLCLRGLGSLLETEESRNRKQLDGHDDREIDAATNQQKSPRWPGSNSDPWYDGRGHNYTIVDSPHSGTVLTPDEIEQLLLRYGQREESDMERLSLPSPDETTVSLQETDAVLQQLSYLGERTPAVVDRRGPLHPDVFISYPRSRLDWVEQNVYWPLKELHNGAARIFFDKNTLNAGGSWLAELADGIEHCRVFLPVYCVDYFERPFCRWELQLAITRDPVGEERIVIPFLIEPVRIPSFCRLIQVVDGTSNSAETTLLDTVRQLLSL